MENSVIAGNLGYYGGVLAAGSEDAVRVDNGTIMDNRTPRTNDVPGGLMSASTNVLIRNTILWDNDPFDLRIAGTNAVAYSLVERWYGKPPDAPAYPGAGNLNFDPRPGLTPEYRLKAHALCIDRGMTNGVLFDRDGQRRLGATDLGADEFVNADGDGMDDAWELAHGLNPTDPADWASDADHDGRCALQEYMDGTRPEMFDAPGADSDGDGVPDAMDPAPSDPALPANPGLDTDGDGIPDWWAAMNGVTNAYEDSDQDGLYNLYEFQSGTNPQGNDSDSDGAKDGAEFFAGTSPLDSSIYPVYTGTNFPDGPYPNNWLISVNMPGGQYILLNDNNDDADGVVDTNDGFNADGLVGTADDANAREHFAEVTLTLDERFTPLAYKGQITHGSNVRVWVKPGEEIRKLAEVGNDAGGGSLVPTGEHLLWDLGFRNRSTITLYVEGIAAGAGFIRLEVTKRYAGQAGWLDASYSGWYGADVTVLKVEFLEDATTDYNFSPSLGEKAKLKVKVSPTPPTGGFSDLAFALYIARETDGGTDQIVEWLDVADPDYKMKRQPLDFGEMSFEWDGIPNEPYGHSRPEASGPEEFQGLSTTEHAHRFLPAIAEGEPVPPPICTAVARVFNPSTGAIICEARKHVFIPQVVLLVYEDDAVSLLRSQLKAADNTVLYDTISSSQWTAMKTQIKNHLVGFYNATDANIRILDDATGLSSPYTVVRLKEGSAYYEGQWGYGPCDYNFGESYGGTYDTPNGNPADDCAWVLVWNHRDNISDSYAISDPLPPLPLGPDNLSWGIAITACHELGHSLGLVYHNSILGGSSMDHNPGTPPSGFRWHLQQGGDPAKEHLDPASDWCWKDANINYLKFILPKE